MCCLFGLMDPNHTLSGREKSKILHILATAAEARGTDATGVAYNDEHGITIKKNPIPGHKMYFRIGNDTSVITGHTRMVTQGSEHFNRNNHPFYGHTKDGSFALAHNGIIYNDLTLRRTLSLPATRIETDSYIAVQLLEHKNSLDFTSLKYMAEQLYGSFTFTVLNDRDDLFIVRGDNPFCLLHYPKLGLYLYASTSDILKAALKRISIPNDAPKEVKLECGDIIRISRDGNISHGSFNASKLFYEPYIARPYTLTTTDSKTNYLKQLRELAMSFGYTPEMVDRLSAHGFEPEEIEEFFYEGMCEY